MGEKDLLVWLKNERTNGYQVVKFEKGRYTEDFDSELDSDHHRGHLALQEGTNTIKYWMFKGKKKDRKYVQKNGELPEGVTPTLSGSFDVKVKEHYTQEDRPFSRVEWSFYCFDEYGSKYQSNDVFECPGTARIEKNGICTGSGLGIWNGAKTNLGSWHISRREREGWLRRQYGVDPGNHTHIDIDFNILIQNF